MNLDTHPTLKKDLTNLAGTLEDLTAMQVARYLTQLAYSLDPKATSITIGKADSDRAVAYFNKK